MYLLYMRVIILHLITNLLLNMSSIYRCANFILVKYGL